MKRIRVVIEVSANDHLTEGSIARMMEDIVGRVTPEFLRRRGVLPSSIKAKRYSRVVAAEYGAVPDDVFDDRSDAA